MSPGVGGGAGAGSGSGSGFAGRPSFGSGGTVRGVVAAFDADTGLGSVTASDDGRSYGFHCTAIAGGTRTIEAGTAVSFVVVAGQLGQWEAAEVDPAPAPVDAA